MSRNPPQSDLDTIRTKISQGRNHSFRIGNNAYWTNQNGVLTLTLHWTPIVKIDPDQNVTLDTNSWHTPTTSRYMNSVKGIQTFIKAGIIHVKTPDGDLAVNPTASLTLTNV